MARDLTGNAFGTTATDYLQNTNAVISALPCTLAAWGYADFEDGTPKAGALLSVGGTGTTERLAIYMRAETSNNVVGASHKDATTNGEAFSTTERSINTWHHVCGVFNSTTSRDIYLDGGSKGSNTTSVSLPTLDDTRIGCLNNSGAAISGYVAEAAIWNVALTAAEISALASGYSPLLIRPGSLVYYPQLIGRISPEIDIVGGYDMTLNGSPTTANHPPIIYPNTAIIPYGQIGQALQIRDIVGGLNLVASGNPVAAAHPSIIYPQSALVTPELITAAPYRRRFIIAVPG